MEKEFNYKVQVWYLGDMAWKTIAYCNRHTVYHIYMGLLSLHKSCHIRILDNRDHIIDWKEVMRWQLSLV